ncbi:platelet-derived growth factor receptor alpha isoform X2 [Drosophila novamexicana]|uniref:platelet-derived growth factor receptor alpha isoform X2 n=1 Tax=Drosophila novamexicana TaxID=47314 RepID=UPI0011E589F4|nr:platelet-derived growth factor receptor alpha isoform X2 [Drosophila novamexicana]
MRKLLYVLLGLIGISIFDRLEALPRPQNDFEDNDILYNCGGEMGVPLITPCKDSLKLDAGTSYTLQCEASEPIDWWHGHYGHKLSETFDNLGDPQRPYGIRLTLDEVSVENVGAYYCIKSSLGLDPNNWTEETLIELVNNNEASTIYVFVNDKSNLLAPLEPIIQARQYSEVIIPCKPAMPETEVLLTFNSDTFSSETAARYDPKRGFVIEIRSVTDGGEYYCEPKIPSPDNEEESTIIVVRFIAFGLDDNTLVPSMMLTNITHDEFKVMVIAGESINVTNSVNDTVALIISGAGHVANAIDNVIDNDIDSDNYTDNVTTETQDPETDYSSSLSSSSSFSPSSSSSPRRPKRSPTKLAPMQPLPSRQPKGQATDRLNKPNINSTSRGHVYEGQTFQLVCELSAPYGVSYDMHWLVPDKVDKFRYNYTEALFDERAKNTTHRVGRSKLTVTDARLTDKGAYKCVVSDSFRNMEYASYRMHVMQPNSSYLKVSEPSNHYTVHEHVNRTIQMTANFEGFPQPTFKWYKPNGIEVWDTEQNFQILATETSTTLKIQNAQLEDSGSYVLKGTNGIDVKQLSFNVSVISGPVLSMDDVYVVAGQEAHLNCSVKSFPQAVVTFLFKPCSLKPRWPSCELASQNFSYKTKTRPGLLSVESIHEAIFTPDKPGIIICVAQNQIDNKLVTSQTRAHVLLGTIAENISISGLDPNRKIAKGDQESFTCAALAYHFDGNLEWYLDGELISEGPDVELETNSTEYSYTKTLKFHAIADKDRGTYECRARYINDPDKYDSREITVYVHDPKAPQWSYTNLNAKSKIERNLGDSLILECKSKAVPQAKVSWYKDDVELFETNRTHLVEDGTKLLIPHLYPKHDGIYRCVVANRLGSIENSVTVVIANIPGVSKLWIWVGAIFFGVLIALCAFLAVRYREERKNHLALKAAGLANFVEGDVEQINPALSLDEQAELLPYNREFEFPRDKLKLGKQLGAGAFGVVLKGEAEGIRSDEPVSTVAVKMVKRTADAEVVRALVSELKIMVHLGQHLNVVNLLGAVTKNIAKRELMVIVEYCRFGNIQNFLLRNRKCFINQINPINDRIDPSIMTQRISDNFDLHRDGGGLKYVNVGFPNHPYINHVNNNYTHTHRRNSDNDPRSGTRAGRTVTGGSTYDRQLDTCATEATVMTTVPEDEHIMSNNSIQPAWRSNYKTDSTEAMTVTTTDLFSWAFQVARGMYYLSSKKVLHGDLAARNILLCEDNVVKICDFGLARSMYRGDNYKKSESGKLPIKWLALESLSDHVFSTYSDVWSFGIVLWELFSLAKVPYPGIDPNQELFNKLNDGYRMEKPPYANQEVYEIMLECWRKNPESRPLFNVLERRFANILGEDVANHYLDLNDPYMRSNTEYMKNRPTDYLSLMGSPDEFAPAAPRYVNGHIVPDIRIEASPDDYLQMNAENSTAIFSPTRPKGDANQSTEFADLPAIETNETSFTFPDTRTVVGQHSPTLANNMDSSAHKPMRRKNGMPTVDAADQAPEEIPMLHRTSTSDGERSPEQARRFPQALKQQYVTPTPSPRHHIETTLNGSSENYVNVKPPRKNLVNKSAPGGSSSSSSTDAFSNPSYQPLAVVNEKQERRY